MKSTAALVRRAGTALALPALLCLVWSCDSTPRQRQEAVQEGTRKLDTAAHKAGVALKAAGGRAARWNETARARKNQPLDKAATAAFTQELLGTYTDVEKLTVPELEPAYVQLLRQTRAKRRQWTQRDWDYASAVFERLNAQYRAIRLDLPARQEIHIKALQAEFTTLETGRDLGDLGNAVRDKPVRQ